MSKLSHDGDLMVVMASSRPKSSPTAFSEPRAWWISPVTVSLLVAVASIVPAAIVSDQKFRSLWRTPKVVTSETLLLFGCGAGAIAFGALITIAAAPQTRPPTTAWPALNDHSVRVLRRATTVLTGATLIGYAGFLILILRSGVSPIELFSGSASYRSGVSVRDVVGTLPGVTTLTQFGVAAVVTSAILLVRDYSRSELYKMLTIIGLAVLRAFIFSERLAIMELVIPVVVILVAKLSIRQGWRRTVARISPFISLVAVVLVFGTFEYFRSWTFFRTHATASYADFAVSRFVGYYATALNNGQLVLEKLDWPNRLPYETIEGFWTAPGIYSMQLYETLGGHAPPSVRPGGAAGSLYTDVLSQFGNPEFNNESGYAGVFVDFGPAGGILFFFLVGIIAGFLYRSFCEAKPLGLLIYPVVFVGLLELPRYIYWSNGRTFYAWIGLAVVVALVSRAQAKESHEI